MDTTMGSVRRHDATEETTEDRKSEIKLDPTFASFESITNVPSACSLLGGNLLMEGQREGRPLWLKTRRKKKDNVPTQNPSSPPNQIFSTKNAPQQASSSPAMVLLLPPTNDCITSDHRYRQLVPTKVHCLELCTSCTVYKLCLKVLYFKGD